MLKISHIRPVIKKSSLDPEDLNNYRPISNLSFLSKVLEKIVALQITSYLAENNLCSKMQSAYKKNHSTETVILRVFNDINHAIDNQMEVVLILLDLSAAFDTIDHKILIERLRDRFGFKNTALQWFKDYLSNRLQSVIINDYVSEPRKVNCGVPQGSVLGPLLFSLYVSPWEDVVNAHGLTALFYADEVFVTMKQSQRQSGLNKLQNCINELLSWNTKNMLKCNPEKTEILHFTSRFRSPNPIPHIKIGPLDIVPVDKARNLGIILDSHLTLRGHINKICSSASKSIHEIGKIRKYLSTAQTEKLVHAFISSKLDYCNSILTGLPLNDITLQKMHV